MSFDVGGQPGPGPRVIGALPELRRLLVDLSRCPNCAAALTGPRCPVCGIDLSGPEAARVQTMSRVAAEALDQREVALQFLRAQAARARTEPRAELRTPASAAPSPGAPPVPSPPPPPGPVQPPWPDRGPERATPSWLSVNTILVGAGALLLAVAAIGFLIFSWQSMPLAGRAAVIGGVTLAALGTATWLRPRLPETAEAVGALAVVLLLGDTWAVRSTGLLGADEPDVVLYTGSALVVVGLLLETWGRTTKVRAGTHASALLLPLGAYFLTAQLTHDLVDTWQLGLIAGALVTLCRRTLPPTWQNERIIARITAALMLAAATVPSWLGLPELTTAALGAVAVTAALAAQTWADRPLAHTPSSNKPQPTNASPPPSPHALNRAWSLAAGVSIVAAAAVGGGAVAEALSLHGVTTLIPVVVEAGLLLIPFTFLRPHPEAALRRTAAAIGALATYGLIALPTLTLTAWHLLRPIPTSARAHDAGTRLGDIGAQQPDLTRHWLSVLAGLAVIIAVGWVVGRGQAWPSGPWPKRVHRLLNRLPLPLAASAVVLVALTPAAPVAAGVAALLVLSFVAVALALRRWQPPLTWTAAVLTGTLAVILAWGTEQLPGAVTLLAAVAVLGARRRFPGTDENTRIGRAALALLAAILFPVALAVLIEQLGADQRTSVIWTALISGSGVAALLTIARLPIPRRPGRADWSPLDRLIATAPGLVALGIGYFTAVSDPDQLPAVTRPALILVALVIALSGVLFIRAALATAYPQLPQLFAGLSTPLLGFLAATCAEVWNPDTISNGLIWSLSTAVGTAAVTVGLVSDRADAPRWKQRRIGAEIGLLAAGLIAVSVTLSGDADTERVWLTLLILGVSASAIALNPDRSEIGWLAGLLLAGSSWLRLADAGVQVVEAYTVPPALALLAVQLWAHRRNPSLTATSKPSSYPQWYQDLGVLARPLLIGVVPSVLAVGVRDEIWRPILLMTMGGLLVAGTLYAQRSGRLTRPGLARALVLTGMVIAVATALLRTMHRLDELAPMQGRQIPLTALEAWTVPAALILLTFGLNRFQHLEKSTPAPDIAHSWPTVGPGLLLLLSPSFLATLSEAESPLFRPVLVLVAAALAVAAGAVKRMQAPLIGGAVTLAAQALILIGPWLQEVGQAVPLWAWAAIVGLALLVLGGGYERRLAQLRTVRSRLAALR
ncbi:hypothetical protein Kisp01_24910 [Kineosporia sp. NBRC 101677]|uniref:SCO7613 C-terminal domain-containing membrane protein n=1 Tax=Kineosporia sp. NBRC 101677 TaxID=3032197 RepID=UPI0024A5B49F|nr:hypothetical protein [Kineosporia sp. NBRC 101677]GLY15476.1 hypothetical protein Kisp01_24910 [Kineosporia sp. NBRC 101677]